MLPSLTLFDFFQAAAAAPEKLSLGKKWSGFIFQKSTTRETPFLIQNLKLLNAFDTFFNGPKLHQMTKKNIKTKTPAFDQVLLSFVHHRLQSALVTPLLCHEPAGSARRPSHGVSMSFYIKGILIEIDELRWDMFCDVPKEHEFQEPQWQRRNFSQL